MADSFSDTTRQGFLSRIGGSLMGLLIGPLLVIGAIILLSWNEGRAVSAINGLREAGGEVVEVHDGHVAPANDGKLVHLTGAITAQTPVRDDALGVDFASQVLVQRDASMYQWVEHKKTKTKHHTGGSTSTTTTYTYSTEWSGGANDSGQFKHPEGHANPAMPFTSERLMAGGPKLDDFSLDAAALHGVDPTQALSPTAPTGWRTKGNTLFNGDPASPKVGDMRVSYRGLPSGATISILAAQSGQGFAPFITSNGYSIELAETGQRPASVLLADKRRSESTLTWILRGVGAVAIFLGFLMFLSPLATLASVLPFLGRLVGGATALISLVLTVPLTLVVIALAWLAVRPWLGGALLVTAAVALYFLGRWHRAHKRARAGAASQASQSPPPPPPPLPSASPPPPPGPPPAPPPLPSNA